MKNGQKNGHKNGHGNGKVRVAVVGVGNCASSLIQGVHYYRNASETEAVPGLMQFTRFLTSNFTAAIGVALRREAEDLVREEN